MSLASLLATTTCTHHFLEFIYKVLAHEHALVLHQEAALLEFILVARSCHKASQVASRSSQSDMLHQGTQSTIHSGEAKKHNGSGRQWFCSDTCGADKRDNGQGPTGKPCSKPAHIC
jgi:hypothetical protein